MDHYETRTWPAWHRHMAHTALAHLFLVSVCLQWQKSPALTVPQAHQLIAQAIEEATRPLRDVLAIVHYRQRRNHAAYRSPRKRTLQRLRRRPDQRKRKTSK
jgi:hypothetical protein